MKGCGDGIEIRGLRDTRMRNRSVLWPHDLADGQARILRGVQFAPDIGEEQDIRRRKPHGFCDFRIG